MSWLVSPQPVGREDGSCDNDGIVRAEAPVPLVRDVARLLLRRLQGETAPTLKPVDLSGYRWGRLALSKLALSEGQKKYPAATERLGPEALEQVTAASVQGSALTVAYESSNLETGFAVTGRLVAEFNNELTRLLKLSVTETRIDGAGGPAPVKRLWQVEAKTDLPAPIDGAEVRLALPRLTVSCVEERGGKPVAKWIGGAEGILQLGGE